MARKLWLASLLAVSGCDGEYFAHPFAGEKVCEASWSGAWIPSEDWAREISDPDGTTVAVSLLQPSGCDGSTLVVQGCDHIPGEEEDCGTLSWSIAFVRVGGRTFANLLLKDINGEAQSDRGFAIVEIRSVEQSRAEILVVSEPALIESIDTGRLRGAHRPGPHGPIINVTSSSQELSDALTGRSFFGDPVLTLERP